MKRLMIGLLGAFAFAALAQAADPPQDPVAQETAAPAATVEKAKSHSDDRICLRETGTRIQRRDRKDRCVNANGRSYTREDLDRTGDVNLADALRRLDPAIR